MLFKSCMLLIIDCFPLYSEHGPWYNLMYMFTVL